MTPELQAAFDKILAVEHARLPPAVQKLMLSPPVLTAEVEATANGFALVDAAALPSDMPHALVPKLGIKSWRDSGSLNVIYEGMSLASTLGELLTRPTPAQRTLANAWLQGKQPLQAALSKYVDFTDISEARFIAGPRDIRAVSQCLRGASTAALPAQMPRMQAALQQLVKLLPARSHLIDMACLPDGSVRLVEINPALSPKDLAALLSLQ